MKKKSVLASERFAKLLINGKIRKHILPNTASDYTGSAEIKDLIRYKKFINSAVYDDFKNCEVSRYNADE